MRIGSVEALVDGRDPSCYQFHLHPVDAPIVIPDQIAHTLKRQVLSRSEAKPVSQCIGYQGKRTDNICRSPGWPQAAFVTYGAIDRNRGTRSPHLTWCGARPWWLLVRGN